MLKVLKATTQLKQLATSNVIKRTFLSQSYYCNDVWSNRLNNPILEKVKLDELYQELDQRFQKNGLISAVDVDIFVNAVNDEAYIDELLDITHKLRLSADTTNTLNSTSHAIVRCLLEHDRKPELLNALDDRLNYGIFLDYYTANILMDKFYKSQDFVSGSRVASQLMLQDETNHKLSQSFALLHCYNFLLNPVGWPEPIKPEEPEDEVKIRVKYLRNPYDDNHFDLTDPTKIVGKTLLTFTKDCSNTLEKSLHVLGLILYGNNEKAKNIIAKMQENNDKVYADIIKLIPDDNEIKQDVSKLQSDIGNLKQLLETQVNESEKIVAENDIKLQKDTYLKWIEERKEAIERQQERLLTAQRLENIELSQKELKAREEKLWFFENKEKIELDIEGKKIYYPKRWFGKKKTPRKVDVGYVPPEL